MSGQDAALCAGSTTQILHAHVYDPLLIPTEVLESLPAAAVNVLRRSMMKEPADRYQTANEMAEDLSAVARMAEAMPAEEADATLTMASLPVADGIRTTSAQILVPARPISRPAIPAAEGMRPMVRRREPTPASLPVAASAGRTKRPNRLGIALLGVALVALTAMLAITLLSGVLPIFDAGEEGAITAGTLTPAAVAAVETPAVTEAAGTPIESRPIATPTADAEQAPAADATALPPLEASLDFAWETAQALFNERDWDEAVTWLVAVQRIDPEFEQEMVSAMLAEALRARRRSPSKKNGWMMRSPIWRKHRNCSPIWRLWRRCVMRSTLWLKPHRRRSVRPYAPCGLHIGLRDASGRGAREAAIQAGCAMSCGGSRKRWRCRISMLRHAPRSSGANAGRVDRQFTRLDLRGQPLPRLSYDAWNRSAFAIAGR